MLIKSAPHRERASRLPGVGKTITSDATGITYEIGVSFAKGFFGRVHYCTDDWGHDLVAKVLKPIGSRNEMEERAANEVRASHKVRSPHIVHVHDAFVYRGEHYIISERCLTSLRQLIKKSARNPVWFPALVKALLHALHYMHTRDLIHGDIHAGNVFLHRKKDALRPDEHDVLDFKLGDFGQTRHISEDHLAATWNDGYTPPEVFDEDTHGPIDHRADLYQAGLLFLEVLTRNLTPFTERQVLAGVPARCAVRLAHPAAAVLERLLEPRAELRFATALETWKAFDGAMA